VTGDFDRVELADVSRHYGRRRAVSKINFSVSRGEILGLLGPNGAGKSTLIAMLATLVRPTSGSIRYGGRTADEAGASLRSRIGLLAHELHLYNELSAAQNLAFFAQLHGLDPGTAVPAALEQAGLVDRGDDVVASFSRGMRQRLGLERALINRPNLLLLDEPFTGLDDRAVTAVTGRLRRIASEGAIIVLATHDLDVADGLVTRSAIIKDGKLVLDESAAGGLRGRYRQLVGHA
jgi:heme ABC exporter ATP-binding subunit CcmA